MNKCEYCEKTFSSIFNRDRHTNNSLRCIKTRQATHTPTSVETWKCTCGYTATRKDAYMRHITACTWTIMSVKVDAQAETISIHLKTIKDREKTIARMHQDHERTVRRLEEQVKLLISRPINVTQNNTIHNNNYNNKFYTQYVLDNFESLTPNLLQGVMEKMTLVDISHGGTGLAKFAKKHLDHQHLLMLDQARRKGLYKDANGEAKQDSELRDLLTIIGQTAFPPANILFAEWSVDNKEDCFLNQEKSSHLTRLLDVVGWLKRVGNGIIHDQDSDTQAQFLGEFVAGFSKEALHNCIERPSEPPLIEEEEVEDKPEDVPEMDSDSSEWPEEEDDEEDAVDSDVDEIETVIEMDIASSEFDIDLGILSYEADRHKGIADDRNYWIEYKNRSKFR
jgi:hypothetical protein